jgi:hypothetical protein
MAVKRKKNYGRTITGELITDELIEKISREAEEGWDVEELLAREESASASSEGDPTPLSQRSRQRQ